jgi:predicted PurR-regulated permease PerM
MTALPEDADLTRPYKRRALPPGSGWLIVAGCAVLLYVARAAFVPVALAVLFALVLSIPVEALHRKGLPRSLSAALILVAFLALVAGSVNLLWAPATEWLAAAPRTVQTIERKLGPAARVIRRVEAVMDRASHLTDAGTKTSAAPAPAQPQSGLLTETRGVVVGAVTVAILMLFLLAGGPPMLARMTTALASDDDATRVLKIIGAVRSEVSRYYATIALINAGLGLATGLVMWLLGMPNPILWGALAALLNFVPYVGSATTLVILTVVAFVSFDGIGGPLAVAASYLALATIEGQIVQPLLVGQRLELNPIIVFLALWFGGWFWGVAGIVIAIPLLVALKVVAEHSRRGHALVAFLSPSGKRALNVVVPPPAA